MHDGTLKDLKQVLDFYIGGGNSHPNLDKQVRPTDFLTGQSIEICSLSSVRSNGELPSGEQSGRRNLRTDAVGDKLL